VGVAEKRGGGGITARENFLPSQEREKKKKRGKESKTERLDALEAVGIERGRFSTSHLKKKKKERTCGRKKELLICG